MGSLQETTCSNTAGRTTCKIKRKLATLCSTPKNSIQCSTPKNSIHSVQFPRTLFTVYQRTMSGQSQKEFITLFLIFSWQWIYAILYDVFTCSLSVYTYLTFLYLSISIHSSWLSRTRLVPTKIRSSRLSCSRFVRSLVWPWCCMRTQSLFISEKFRRIKSMESSTVPYS